MTLDKVFVLLLLCHQLADQPWQSDLMARAKRGQMDGCPAWLGLLYHGFMHGALVLLVTQSMVLFVAETLAHAFIDRNKCRGRLNVVEDQLLHVMCKVLWIVYLVWRR